MNDIRKRPTQAPYDHGPGSAPVPLAGPPRQARGHPHEAHGDATRPVAGLFPRRRRAGESHLRGSEPRLRLHVQGQHGGGHLERHRDPRARQPRRPGLEARDGGQGGAVQALRRHRFDRSRNRQPRTPDAFIAAVRYLGPSFGGINLEDIKAPECFIIEDRLRELMDIPVFHGRPARHGHHRGGRHAERHEAHGPRHQGDQARLQRRGCGGDRLPRPHQGHGVPGPERSPVRTRRGSSTRAAKPA